MGARVRVSGGDTASNTAAAWDVSGAPSEAPVAPVPAASGGLGSCGPLLLRRASAGRKAAMLLRLTTSDTWRRHKTLIPVSIAG